MQLGPRKSKFAFARAYEVKGHIGVKGHMGVNFLKLVGSCLNSVISMRGERGKNKTGWRLSGLPGSKVV